MNTSKRRNSSKVNRKKLGKLARKSRRINGRKSKLDIRRKRRKAARIKARAEAHRRKHRQEKTHKGFFAVFGSYLAKILTIEEDFKGKPFAKKANSQYSTADVIRAFVCLIVIGIGRVYHANSLQDEHLLAGLLGLRKFPSAATLYRFLKAFGTRTFCRRVQRVNRDRIAEWMRRAKEIVCDGDSSTLQTYEARKEGSCKGFNKKRPGSFCLQALQYFVNGMSVLPDILPGNKVPPKAFSTLADLKDVRRICGRIDWIRLDAGFASQMMLESLDGFSRTGNSKEKVKYIMNVGKGCMGSREALMRSRCREWTRIRRGLLIQDHGLCRIYKDEEKPRRLLLVKEYFSGGEGKGGWQHYALCSSEEDVPAITLLHFYNQRQTIENFFDEAKNDYNLEHLPCTKIMGNALYFNLLCLAFNLLHLFRIDILREQDQKIRLSTFQRTYIQLRLEFDGKVISIFRSALFHYRRIVTILHRLRKLDIVLQYRIC